MQEFFVAGLFVAAGGCLVGFVCLYIRVLVDDVFLAVC